MPAFVDTHRDIGLTTPVDKGELLLRRMSGTEGLGQVSEFHLDLVSENRALDATRYLGKPMTVSLRLDDHEKRHFHGFVTRFSATGVEGGLFGYRVTLHAWPWLLSRSVDCRIFQEKTVPQIIEQVFKDFGMSDYKLSLQNTYSPRTYCVQYRETHLDFVSRLMEEEGIYYFFRHEKNNHTLVTCNTPGTHQPFPGYAQMKFRETQDQLTDLEAVTDWRHAHELTTGKVTWAQPKMRRCTLTKIDGHLMCMAEDGTLTLLKANPDKFEPVAVWDEKDNEDLRPPCWAPPVVSHGLLYLRGKGKLACYELIPK